jgi:hypothetical protein
MVYALVNRDFDKYWNICARQVLSDIMLKSEALTRALAIFMSNFWARNRNYPVWI